MHGFDARAPLLPEILELHGRWRASKPALVAGGVTESWGEFYRSLSVVAGALSSHGIVPGDRVAVLMANETATVHALFGTMLAGAVSVPINLSIPDDAVIGTLHDSGARAVIVTPDQRERIDALRDRCGADLSLFVQAGEPVDGWLGWREFVASARTEPQPAIADDALLNIIYSSGTTGVPKGIAHTHAGRRDWAYDLAIALRYHGGARTLATIGLYSNISWVAMLCTLLAGGTLYVHPRFDADAFLDAVERDRITHTAMVPIQYQRVLDAQRVRRRDASSLQAMMSCGSPLHGALRQALFAEFPCGVIELYGLTEGIITTLDPEEAPGHWASVGKPLIGTDLRIIDEAGRELERGQSGEIVGRGRITMPGYYRRPEATAEATWADPHGRRWLRTGDIGRLDDEGFLYIVDRKKDMILSGGQNVYPADIEAVMRQHPAIADVAVIGIPSERWGETPLAVVVARAAGESVSPQVLVDWTNARVGRQQRISQVVYVADLPRNPNGKILKRELRTHYAHLGSTH
jgi:acyl-CoA synthetase (AMP-forming)/AMP-acid ligase II